MSDADENADNPMKNTGNPAELRKPAGHNELLEVSEEKDSSSKYRRIFENFSQLGNLFTRDDWLDILTHSRGSYEEKLRGRRR